VSLYKKNKRFLILRSRTRGTIATLGTFPRGSVTGCPSRARARDARTPVARRAYTASVARAIPYSHCANSLSWNEKDRRERDPQSRPGGPFGRGWRASNLKSQPRAFPKLLQRDTRLRYIRVCESKSRLILLQLGQHVHRIGPSAGGTAASWRRP